MFDSKISLTVVTCIFNGRDFIDDYFSALQNVNDLVSSVLIIDDGSTDDTLELLQPYLDKNNKLKVISKANTGLPDSRNFSLDYVDSDCLLFLDVDDFIIKKGLIASLSALQAPNVDYVYGQVEYFSKNNSKKLKLMSLLRQCFVPDVDKISTDIFFNNFLITPGSCVFKSKVVKSNEFNKDLSIGEDWEFFTRVIPRYNGYYINEGIIEYFVHDQSMSSKLANQTKKLESLKLELLSNYEKISYNLDSSSYDKYLDMNFYIFYAKKNVDAITYSEVISNFVKYVINNKVRRGFVLLQVIKIIWLKTFQ